MTGVIRLSADIHTQGSYETYIPEAELAGEPHSKDTWLVLGYECD
jgi:hypothetical protein